MELNCHVPNPADSDAVQITQSNIDMIIASYELVLINFYTDTFKNSNTLFDYVAVAVRNTYAPGKVIIGKVDCDKEGDVATRFNITRYPMLKIFQNGVPPKKEYHGLRNIHTLCEFVKKQLVENVIILNDPMEVNDLSGEKNHVIAYMDKPGQPEFDVFRKVASNLKDYCLFYAGFGNAFKEMHPPEKPVIVIKTNEKILPEPDDSFHGDSNNFKQLYDWVQDVGIPLVRELKKENVDDFNDEGLPFLTLYHHPTDVESVEKYKEVIHRELKDEKHRVNFLTANGLNFEHTVVHVLKKTMSDLPLIAIDSKRYMHLLPNFSEMVTPGKLKQSICDLYSGKLDRERENK